MKRILVTFAGGHLAHGVCMALRAAPEPVYIVGTDSSKFHLHQAEADETHLVPRGSDEEYFDVISQIAEETKVDLIWPMHDDEVEKVAIRADNLPARTWLPPLEVVSLCRDKLATNKRLEKAGAPVPPTHVINTYEDLESLMDRFGCEIWIRANKGAGGKGAFKADSLERAKFWLDMNNGWGHFTGAKVLPGPGEYSRDLIWKNGELIMSQHETRVVRGGGGYKGAVVARGVQLRDAPPEVNEISEKAVRAVMPEPDGLFRVDMTADENGLPNVTEVDAGRFSSGGPVNWHRFGYNMAYEALRLAFDEPVNYPTPVIDPYPKDVVAIGGRNQDQKFVSLADVAAKEKELADRLKKA